MKCIEFQRNINDFVYGKIDNKTKLREFISHAETCEYCMDDLELYYSIHRGLDDLKAPKGLEGQSDYQSELETLIFKYREEFDRVDNIRILHKTSLMVFMTIMFLVCAFLFMDLFFF